MKRSVLDEEMDGLIYNHFRRTMLLLACNQGDSNKGSKSGSDKLQIKTTVYPLKSFIEQIGGEHVEVESIYHRYGFT